MMVSPNKILFSFQFGIIKMFVQVLEYFLAVEMIVKTTKWGCLNLLLVLALIIFR